MTNSIAKTITVQSYIKAKTHATKKDAAGNALVIHQKVNPTMVLTAPVCPAPFYENLGMQAYLFAKKTIAIAKQSASSASALKLGVAMPYGDDDESASRYMAGLLESIGIKEVEDFFKFERSERVTNKGLISYFLDTCYPALVKIEYFLDKPLRAATLKNWLSKGVDLPLDKKVFINQWLNDSELALDESFLALFNALPDIEELDDMPE